MAQLRLHGIEISIPRLLVILKKVGSKVAMQYTSLDNGIVWNAHQVGRLGLSNVHEDSVLHIVCFDVGSSYHFGLLPGRQGASRLSKPCFSAKCM